jgi:archaellum biogenesis ATPase FlaH
MNKNERLYVLYLYKNPELMSHVKNHFFTDEILEEFFNVGKAYYDRFKEIPDKFDTTLTGVVGSKKYKGEISKEHITALFKEDIGDYDTKWLHDSFLTWVKLKSFQSSLSDTVSYIKSQDITSENVDNVFSKARQIFNDTAVVIDDDLGINYFDLATRSTPRAPKIDSGKNFLNDVLGGGYTSKTLICYLGQQGVGKSLWMCNDAAHFVQAGYNTIYISAEMDEWTVMKRIDCVMLDIPIKKYQKYIDDIDEIATRLDSMNMYGVVPGALQIKQMADPSVLDIEDYIKRCEKVLKIKFQVVIVDYIGIMSNYRNPNSENMYLNMKKISKDLRDSGMRNDWLFITAMQVGKGAWDKTTLKITDIAESAGIAHNADLILGIIQSPDMNTENEYWLKVLKIRDGDARNLKCKFDKNPKTLKVIETTIITTEDV